MLAQRKNKVTLDRGGIRMLIPSHASLVGKVLVSSNDGRVAKVESSEERGGVYYLSLLPFITDGFGPEIEMDSLFREGAMVLDEAEALELFAPAIEAARRAGLREDNDETPRARTAEADPHALQGD